MKFTHNDIGELVRRVKQNDSQAFTQLYEQTYQKIYFLALSILKNDYDAQDIVQETYIKILDSVYTLDDESLFIAWSHRIAYRLSLRVLKKRKELPTENDMISEIPDFNTYHDPFTALIQHDQKQHLVKALQQLDPVLRTTILLRYFENMKLSDIAIVMDCPPGTVKSRLRIAKKQLLAFMSKDLSFGIFIGMVSMVPLRGVYHEAAQGVTMSSQAAFSILNNTMAHQGMAAPLTFAPAGSAASGAGAGLAAGAHASGIAILASTVSVAAVALSAAVLLDSPIKQVTLPSSYTAHFASIAIETGGRSPVTELYAVAPDGSRIDGSYRTDGLFEIQVYENGDYVIHAVSENQKKTDQTVTVGSIDNSAPKIESNTMEDGILRVVFTDTQSGADLNSIYGDLQDGTPITPVSIDPAAQCALFSLPEDDFVFYISDCVGNTSKHAVTLLRDSDPAP